MTFPIELRLGQLTLGLHLIFETLGLAIGFQYFLYLRSKQKDKIDDANRIWIIVGATFGAFFFSRLVGALENPVTLIHSQHILLYLYANKTIVGGLLGGLLAVELTKKIIHERSPSGDLFVYPLILAMIIGRIGCFTRGLTEETYGISTSSPFGIDFGDDIHRHPVTLYEMVFLAALWLGLSIIDKRTTLKNGYRFQFFMIAYLAFRLMLDFIKPHFVYFLGLGTIQLCCIIGLFYYRKTLYKIITNFSAMTEDGK